MSCSSTEPDIAAVEDVDEHSYMTYTINGRLFDSHLNNIPGSHVYAAIIEFSDLINLGVSSKLYDPKAFPNNFRQAFSFDYSMINNRNTISDSVRIQGNLIPINTLLEVNGDAIIQSYIPFYHVENHLEIREIDTLGASYVQGVFSSWMRSTRVDNEISASLRQLPDTFRVVNGAFFAKIQDTREE